MDYIIEATQEAVEQVQPAVFQIKYTKEVETVDGEKVVIVDENRTERVTVEQLQAQKTSYLNAIKEIDAKLAGIVKLG